MGWRQRSAKEGTRRSATGFPRWWLLVLPELLVVSCAQAVILGSLALGPYDARWTAPGTASMVVVALGAVGIAQRLRSAKARRALRLTLDHMSQGVAVIDARGRLAVINQNAASLLNLIDGLPNEHRPLTPTEALDLGLRPEGPAHPAGCVWRGTLHRGGRIMETATRSLPDGGLVRTFTDVTERRIADARIRHMAHHDMLTGLANRTLLNERIAEWGRHAGTPRFGLIWLDVGGIQTVNNTMGHDTGDRLIREIRRRLVSSAGVDAMVARTGESEFAVLCADDDEQDAASLLAGRLTALLREPVNIDGMPIAISAHVGLAVWPDDATTPPELLKRATVAAHHAKSRGRGAVVRFDPAMDKAIRERGRIERDLPAAVHAKELELWFQPRIDLATGRVSGFEALARWNHPELGFVAPARFIPIAEQCGLIAELGLMVLEHACQFAAALPGIRMAVNLSPVQFLSQNLPDVVGDVLMRNGIAPDRLELEVTEGVLIGEEAQALATLRRLHDIGVELSLDDFGTGYASLSYLRRFPFDRIKVDQSFVRAQEHDPTTRAIVECIFTMARRLGLEVTAEGVETEAQLRVLTEQGCPEVQGHLLGSPMPPDEAREFLERHVAASEARWDAA